MADAYAGETIDHLYHDCHHLQRTISRVERDGWPYTMVKPGDLLVGGVDPYGTDLCGTCQARYRRQHG